MEADVVLPERLSLSPDNRLQKGRIRLAIVARAQSLRRMCASMQIIIPSPRCTAARRWYILIRATA